MLSFPNCKINIGLNIISRRSDGYHNLETIFYPVYKLHDAVEVLLQDSTLQIASGTQIPDFDNRKLIIADRSSYHQADHIPGVQFSSSGLPIAGNANTNLCIKAYLLLKDHFPELPVIQMFLHKAIPMGAGLGGGSADGAFTLQLLNKIFNLNLPASQLLDYALQLGSDCPFFIINKPAFALGRGEMLQPISLSLTGYSIIIIYPAIHISTAQAFAGIVPKQPAISLQQLILEPVSSWRNTIVNDFEEALFALHPLLCQIKEKFYATGATYAAISGSGSTIYGIYKNVDMPKEKLFFPFFEFHAAL